MTIHDGIKEKVANGIRRGGFLGKSCLGVRVLDGVVGDEVRGGVFPDQALGGRLTAGHGKLVDSPIDVKFREQREGTLDHVGLAVWSLFFHVEAERGISAIGKIEICRGGHDGSCAKDGFPSAPEHAGTECCGKWVGGEGGSIARDEARCPFTNQVDALHSVWDSKVCMSN